MNVLHYPQEVFAEIELQDQSMQFELTDETQIWRNISGIFIGYNWPTQLKLFETQVLL